MWVLEIAFKILYQILPKLYIKFYQNLYQTKSRLTQLQILCQTKSRLTQLSLTYVHRVKVNDFFKSEGEEIGRTELSRQNSNVITFRIRDGRGSGSGATRRLRLKDATSVDLGILCSGSVRWTKEQRLRSETGGVRYSTVI